MTRSLLTQEAMIAQIGAHMQAEAANDVETTLDTMSAVPYWEQCTIGVRAEGREAIRAWYTTVLPNVMLKATDVREIRMTWADNYVVAEHELDVTFPDGSSKLCRHIAYYDFDEDGKIAGERAYCDVELGRIWRGCLDDDFFQVPGVSRY